MKKVGKQVCFLSTSSENRRNGEGSFARLTDGRIFFAYTAFRSSWADEGDATISAIESADEGLTWSSPRVLIRPDENATNVMSVSMLRMANGDLGMFYLYKDRRDSTCRLFLVRSADEGLTWSSPLLCIPETSYFVINNDRVIRLNDGRILFPANDHGLPFTHRGEACFYRSDDDGRSFARVGGPIKHPFPKVSGSGLQESGLYQRENGEIWCYSRTDTQSQYRCFSRDGGETWSRVCPDPHFPSPDSPMLVKRAAGFTVAVFNPTPYSRGVTPVCWARTPYVIAVSEDDGVTFPRHFYLEDDRENGYCYPAIFDGGDYLLVAYYHSDGDREMPLRAQKILRIERDELLTE